MKQKNVFLDDLNTESKAYKVKVKVIEKGCPRTSPKKGLVFQSLLLEDEKGNKMKGALFGDQVEGYKEAFVYNGVYEISNAPIKPCPQQWKTNAQGLDFQMSFGRQTVIQPAEDQTNPILPTYLSLYQIPKSGNTKEKYDVLGIVLHVDETTREITTARGQQVFVREIVVTDHSSEQPLTISVWNDLAETGCQAITSFLGKFKVVGITALRVSTYKGFSLTSSMSTTINANPEGDRADSLGKWMSLHHETLSDRQARVLQVRDFAIDQAPVTISHLKQKNVRNTLQDERHKLQVIIEEADFDKVYAYQGCSSCAARSEDPIGSAFDCSKCLKKGISCVPRNTFSCEVSDKTGSLALTMFTIDSEKAFGMTAADIFHMKHSGDRGRFKQVAEHLRTKGLLIEVRPKTTLTTNSILQWGLRQIMTIAEPKVVLTTTAPIDNTANTFPEGRQDGLTNTTEDLGEQNSPGTADTVEGLEQVNAGKIQEFSTATVKQNFVGLAEMVVDPGVTAGNVEGLEQVNTGKIREVNSAILLTDEKAAKHLVNHMVVDPGIRIANVEGLEQVNTRNIKAVNSPNNAALISKVSPAEED